MRILDLFSGIGGFSLALEHCGMETIAFVEQDKACQKVLKKHWPDIPIFDDVRTFDGKQFKRNTIDLICGGFPCQPWSVAGKQRGDQDDRDLWPEMFRVITEVRPRWVIGENVSGFANYEMGLKRTISDLESEGYETRALNIPACAVGAPHERKRIWIVAHSGSHGRGGGNNEDVQRQNRPLQVKGPGAGQKQGILAHSIQFNDDRSRYDSGPICGERSAQAHISGSEENVAYSNGEGPQGRFSEELRQCPEQRITGPRDTQNYPGRNHWEFEPGICRVANGIPNRIHRLKQLGNTVVPQIVEIIGRAIMATENNTISLTKRNGYRGKPRYPSQRCGHS